MDAERKRFWVKGLAVLLSFSMLAGMVGCGGTGEGKTSENSQVASEIVESSEASAQSTEAATPEPVVTVSKINDNGKAIWDFDEYINGEWKKEQEAKNDGYQSNTSIYDEKMDEWAVDALFKTDPANYSEDDGMYKLITLCHQIEDEGFQSRDARMKTLKKHLEPILKVKKLDDLYKLYKTEEYAFYNDLLHFEVSQDGYLNNMVWLYPMTSLGNNEAQALTNVAKLEQTDDFYPFMKALGFSEERSKEILINGVRAEAKIWKYFENAAQSSMAYYIYEDQLKQEKIDVPMIEIVTALGAEYECYLAPLEAYDYLRDLYQPENLDILRDHLLLSAIMGLGAAVDYSHELNHAIRLYDEECTDEQMLSAFMQVYADEVLTKEYLRTHVSEKTIEDVNAMLEDVKLYARNVVSDSEWLSIHGKELAKRKILRMKVFYAENEQYNDLSDFTLGKDVVENYLALKVNKQRYDMAQTKLYDKERSPIVKGMLAWNAYYVREMNAIVLTAGLLGDPHCTGDVAYEIQLANLGNTIAHEISHSYDPNGSSFDEDGYADPWMTDAEYEAYTERVAKIAAFFDGMEVEYGQKLDGKRVCAEAFADLMAMECCLRMLEKQENPDYDLFFRSYAEYEAAYYTKESMKEAVEDTHLPAKPRINYILGQFDKFYETYEIDESSPYFVPKEDRLPIF